MNSKKIKIISWNINGFRSILKKNFTKILEILDPDILALQELRIQSDRLVNSMKYIKNYRSSFSFSNKKKGYSGVGIYSKYCPKTISQGIGLKRFDTEGRIIQMNFDAFVFFSVYFPNGQMNKKRLEYKLNFYNSFFNYVDRYRESGLSIIISGDFNVAHSSIDLSNDKSNNKRSGFLLIEREWINNIINRGYIDAFRFLYPISEKYSWWSYRFGSRSKNIGWRIDNFFVSNDIVKKGCLVDAFIFNKILGSDHCPIGIVIDV